jgi:serine phosphatase RsbU (regulator of sigma subunit)
MNSEVLESIIASFEKIREEMSVGYIEIVLRNDASAKNGLARSFDNAFEFIPYYHIKETADFQNDPSSLKSLSLTYKGNPLFCITTDFGAKSPFILLIESKSPFRESILHFFDFLYAISDIIVSFKGSEPSVNERKYKTELINMRQMQAMLFPTFSNIIGYDIGAVYLPAQLMSGNFIDALPLGSDILQIACCIVGGYDSASSFVGAAVRTLIRALSGPTVIPSALLETTNQKLARIVSGIHYLVDITVFQLNMKTGRATISSFGPVSTLFYIAGKKKAISLGDTQIGKDLSKRAVFKDISFTLESEDTLLFYSYGALNAENEDGSGTYGMKNLFDRFKAGLDLTSREHVHNISQSIFEFTNYTPIKDDILLTRITKL